MMKFLSAIVVAAMASNVLARSVPQQERLSTPRIHPGQKYLIELAPSKTRWVTEEEKWALKLVCSCRK